MSEYQFSDAQINQWAAEVSDQLNAISAQQVLKADTRRPDEKALVPLIPEPQRAVIESETNDLAEVFWEKYKRHAHRDLCQSDGNLYKLWHKWQDLPTKDVVKLSGGALAAMGFSSNSMGTVGVAASVVLLHVVLNIGIKAICEDGSPASNKASMLKAQSDTPSA